MRENTLDLGRDWTSLQFNVFLSWRLVVLCATVYSVPFPVQAQCDTTGLCQYMLQLSFTAGYWYLYQAFWVHVHVCHNPTTITHMTWVVWLMQR